VPLDGIIVEGYSALDTSALTGESIPQNVQTGDSVASGSVVLSGLLQITVTTLYKDSTVARILELVENATANKSPTENFITRFAKIYTPIVVALAGILAFVPPFFLGFDTLGDWVYRGLIFLVISCPCALVVSVPLGFFSGIGNASKNGILVKGSNYLEALTRLDKVVFDKTGTLTKGKFEVYSITTTPEFSKETIIEYAALCEVHSNHPIAKSIVAYHPLPIRLDAISSFEELSGYGIEAQSHHGLLTVGNANLMALRNIVALDVESPYTIVYVALNGVCIGAIDVRDQIKEDAFEAVKALQNKGISVAMLTGDRKNVADAVASNLGIDIVFSGLLPDQKYSTVKNWLDAGEKIAFVGDGINDAPVLAGSTVGISMGAIGSDAAIEASDVVLMTDEPTKIVKAISIAIKTKRIVKQNIVFALSTKVLIMALGAIGLSSMWMAIFADVGVALIAVLNAMRAMK
jgi:Cd2+/Zn2+-exporting ATPase